MPFSLTDFKTFASAEVEEQRFGPARIHDSFKWNLMAMLIASSPKRLGLFLQCAGDGRGDASTYKAKVNLRVVNYRLYTSDIVHGAGVHTFNKEAFDWGFDHMADISVSLKKMYFTLCARCEVALQLRTYTFPELAG